MAGDAHRHVRVTGAEGRHRLGDILRDMGAGGEEIGKQHDLARAQGDAAVQAGGNVRLGELQKGGLHMIDAG